MSSTQALGSFGAACPSLAGRHTCLTALRARLRAPFARSAAGRRDRVLAHAGACGARARS